jgi:hypothetical protein
MLRNSIQLNPEVEHHVGDMRSIRLGRKFKAVLIHDAINHMLSEEDLRSAFATAADHLDPGGLFVAAPDFFKETFSDPRVDHATHSDEKMELTYIAYSYDPDPGDTTVETIMFYLLRERGGLRIEQDRHVLGLFPRADWRAWMEEAGFTVEEVPRVYSNGQEQGILLVGVLAGVGDSADA